MPSPAASVATQICAGSAEMLPARVLRSCGIHAAVDFAGGVAPAGQVFLEVVERVAVLGEDEKFAAAILEFGELGFGQAFLSAVSLESRAPVAHAAGLLGEFLEGGDFGAELVEFDGGGEFVNQQVAVGIVKVVFILLRVGDAALELGKTLGALRW